MLESHVGDDHMGNMEGNDAGASPTSSEPARKTIDSWTSASTNFEITLEVVA